MYIYIHRSVARHANHGTCCLFFRHTTLYLFLCHPRHHYHAHHQRIQHRPPAPHPRHASPSHRLLQPTKRVAPLPPSNTPRVRVTRPSGRGPDRHRVEPLGGVGSDGCHGRGNQFTGFTSTKVQILTAELAVGRRLTWSRSTRRSPFTCPPLSVRRVRLRASRCVPILPYICLDTTIYVSAYYYICVLMLLYEWSRSTRRSSFMCPLLCASRTYIRTYIHTYMHAYIHTGTQEYRNT